MLLLPLRRGILALLLTLATLCAAAAPTWAADTKPPTAPTSLTAAPAATSVSLAWGAAKDNVGVKRYAVSLAGQVKFTTARSMTITGLTANTAYTAGVRAYDAAGNQSLPAKVSFRTKALTPPADTQAPTAPGNPTVNALTPTSAELTWTASSDNVGVTAYDVSGGPAAIRVTGTTASLTGLTEKTSYTLAITARDAAGNISGASTLTLTTPALPDITAPNAPTGLQATSVTESEIVLGWGAASDNVGVVGYEVSGAGAVVSTTQTSATLSDLTPATEYTLAVTARDAAGNISPAATLTVTTATAMPPAARTGLRTASVTADEARLAWDAPTDAVDHYTITAGERTWTVTGPEATLDGLSPDTAYRVQVRAANRFGGESEPVEIRFRTKDGAAYLHGNLAWFSVKSRPELVTEALASPLVDGLSVYARWSDVTSDGVTFDFSGFDRAAAAAAAAGKPWAGMVVLGHRDNGLPAYIKTGLPEQEWITAPDAATGTDYTFPVFWSSFARTEAERMQQLLADRYSADPNLVQWRVSGLWRNNSEPWLMGGVTGRAQWLEKYRALTNNPKAPFAEVQAAYDSYERGLWDTAAAMWPSRIRLGMAAGDAFADVDLTRAESDPARHPRRLANWSWARERYGNRALLQFNGMNAGAGGSGYGAWLANAFGPNGVSPGHIGGQPVGGVVVDGRMTTESWREMALRLVERGSDYCEFYGQDVVAAIRATDDQGMHMRQTLEMVQQRWANWAPGNRPIPRSTR